MIRVVAIFITFILLLLISMVTITKPLFSIYEEYVLKGHYTGETYAAYYFDFILYLMSPICLIVSFFIVKAFYSRCRKS
jgi:hypothetical protein